MTTHDYVIDNLYIVWMTTQDYIPWPSPWTYCTDDNLYIVWMTYLGLLLGLGSERLVLTTYLGLLLRPGGERLILTTSTAALDTPAQKEKKSQKT